MQAMSLCLAASTNSQAFLQLVLPSTTAAVACDSCSGRSNQAPEQHVITCYNMQLLLVTHQVLLIHRQPVLTLAEHLQHETQQASSGGARG
jgi:hypothetical protein